MPSLPPLAHLSCVQGEDCSDPFVAFLERMREIEAEAARVNQLFFEDMHSILGGSDG